MMARMHLYLPVPRDVTCTTSATQSPVSCTNQPPTRDSLPQLRRTNRQYRQWPTYATLNQ